MKKRLQPNYGIDAPGLVRTFVIGGAVFAVAAAGITAFSDLVPSWVGIVIAVLVAASGYMLGMGSFMIYESRIGKVRGREAILDLVTWRGDERVLDVGCGRGLLLVGAAKRLKTGAATGIDIWQSADQSGNGPEGAIANAAIEGVADRIEIATGDMRLLPFETASFDAVMSHWVVHNLALEADRDMALAEMHRVLRPGGTLIVTDIEHRDAYVACLSALGFSGVRVMVRPMRDAILNAVSFGSFRPATVVGRKSA